jgi:spermidine/putrescine transport system permease protein
MKRVNSFWLSMPAFFWFAFFMIVPLLAVLAYSFAERGTYGGIEFSSGLDFSNYTRAFDPIYVGVFVRSLKLATITSLSCLLIGYPMAYVMATALPRFRNMLMVLIVIPFWTNFVVRTYALKSLFAEDSPIGKLLPFVFSGSSFAVWFGMVTNYLPFMVLPLYVAIEKFDFMLLEAASDLGAPPVARFFKILVPLTRRGIMTGLLFVFSPALGEFVIPDLLGGARMMLVGNLITEQYLKARDWPFGSALSLILISWVMASLAVMAVMRRRAL